METGQDAANLEMGERLLLSIQEQAPGLLEIWRGLVEARKIPCWKSDLSMIPYTPK